MTRLYPSCVWLNPVPEGEWGYTQSIRMLRQLMGGRMYPLTLEGLDKAMRGVGAVSLFTNKVSAEGDSEIEQCFTLEQLLF